MDKIKINGAEMYGEVLPLSSHRIVVRFATGIPAGITAATIEANGKEYTGFNNLFQRHVLTVILSDTAAQQPALSYEEDFNIDDARSAKKAEIGEACRQAIVFGVDVDGCHYSLTADDQRNLSARQLQILAGAEEVSYHADGEAARMFSADEMQAVVDAANKHITEHTTRCNAINLAIAAADAEELSSIYYYSR